MKIRKVDDKPMVIHTKEKAKIHAHEPKGAKIKGSNIYTVERGPKTAGAKVTNTDRKKSYRKSTIHQSEPKKSINIIIGQKKNSILQWKNLHMYIIIMYVRILTIIIKRLTRHVMVSNDSVTKFRLKCYKNA